MSHVINTAPITEAPIEPGESFGPCLLWPGSTGGWSTGYWDGEHWFEDGGRPIAPKIFALLPDVGSAPA